MKKVSTLIILLVCYTSLNKCAQARTVTLERENLDVVHRNSPEKLVDDNKKSKRSVVENWELLCTELCGAELGGPICGPQCNSNEHVDEKKRIIRRTYDNAYDEMCSILCENGLGGTQCICENYQIKNETTTIDDICNNACINNTPFAGCSPCLSDTDVRLDVNHDETQTEENVTQSGGAESTPDWIELCKALCKTGDGGVLCNCDLLPFF